MIFIVLLHARRKLMRRSIRRYVIIGLLLWIAALTGCQSDQSISYSPETSPCNRQRHFDLPAQRFALTARELTQTGDCFITSDLANTSSLHVAAVSGDLSIASALSQALATSHLQITQSGNTLIVH